MKPRKPYKSLSVLCVVCLLLSVLFVGKWSLGIKQRLDTEYRFTPSNDGWTLKSDECPPRSVLPGYTLENIGTEVTLCKEIYPEQMDGSVLFFINNRQGVEVSVEGESLFRLGAGKRHFTFFTIAYCSVDMPLKGRPYQVEVTFCNLEDGRCTVPFFYFSSINDILIFLCRKDFSSLLTIPLFMLIGLVLIAMYIYTIACRKKDPRIICLASFLLVSVFWIITDLYLVPLIPIDTEVIATIDHYLLMFLPIPILPFIQLSCTNRPLKGTRMYLTLLFGNVFVQTLLFLTGVVNVHQMVWVSHVLMLGVVYLGLGASILDLRAKPSRIGKVLIAAFTVSGLIGPAVVLAYWRLPPTSGVYHSLFNITLFVFLLCLTAVVFVSADERRRELQKRTAEYRAYRIISGVDQLTGLHNRRAFDENLQQFTDDSPDVPNAVLVFMDLNGLKYTNDRFGHMAGDELLVAAGKCIRAAFEPDGVTYRIGGDEFAALLIGESVRIEDYFERMDRAVDEHNRNAQLPLSIARGCCTLWQPDGSRLSIDSWKTEADKRMYEHKTTSRAIRDIGSPEGYMEIISGFVSVVDARDSYTADHSTRVGLLTEAICRLLGLSDASLGEIRTAAKLHDIGKIGIPDSILYKKTALTEDETRIMQTHPCVGEEIIKHNRAFYDISQMIRHHHERIDGKGYPDRIAGTDIPLGARIIAIADSIDAMTSDRAYRRAIPADACREEIRQNLGIMYDRAIGTIVLEHWEAIEAIITEGK